jgi:hypothetical protein
LPVLAPLTIETSPSFNPERDRMNTSASDDRRRTSEHNYSSSRYFSEGNTMNDPKDEAEQLFKEAKPAPAMSDYQREALPFKSWREPAA